MVIYIDILVVLNFFINFLVLSAAAALLHEELSRLRLLLSGLFGGLYSLVILLPDMGEAVSVLIKIVGAAVMTLIAFRLNSARRFFRLFGCVCLISFAFAGLMLALYLLFKPENMAVNNGSVYFQISVRLFVVFAVACYLLIKLLLFLIRRYSPQDRLCTVTVEWREKSVSVKALVDTGNSLTDVFTNKPVTTIEKTALKKVLPDENELKLLGKTCVVPVKTALGTGLMNTVRADRMIIEYDKKRWVITSPVIALSESDLSSGDYQALINPMIFESGKTENEKDNKTV